MKDVFEGAKEVRYGRGDIVPTAGLIHYIVEGYVGLYGQSGRVRRLLFVYKASDILPMTNEIIDAQATQYVYVVMKRTRIRSLTQSEFDHRVESLGYAMRLLEYMRKISQLQFERINNMQQIQVFSRLIERLLFFMRRLGIQDGNKVRIDVPLSHVDIATSIGATRETVNRYMRQLESRGVISVRRQHITINDPDKLRQLLLQKDSLSRPNWTLLSMVAGSATLLVQFIK